MSTTPLTPIEAPSLARQCRLRVLVVDDEPMHCELIEQSLAGEEGFAIEVVVSATIQEARQRLRADQFDCILLDHNLPDGRGVELLEEMQELALMTPVIGISTSADPEVALADFRGGCVEFIRKEDAFRGRWFRHALLGAMAQFHRRSLASMTRGGAIVDAQQDFVTAARTDALTGLCNRAVYEDTHADLHRRMKEEHACYAISMVDVDHFKKYNDTFGHAAGDEALRQVAHAVQRVVRDCDLVARYGGEEIVLLLERADATACASVAQRTLKTIRALQLRHTENAPHGIVTVSIGATVVTADSQMTTDQAFHKADMAMYGAKRSGRNCFVLDGEDSEGDNIDV